MRYYNNFGRKFETKPKDMREGPQHGEEGVVNELFKRLEITKGWLVDCGSWNGKCFSNIFLLIKTGNYYAVDIEGDELRYKGLLDTVKQHPNITPFNKFVSNDKDNENSLINILKQTEIPLDFELLNIDIDSYDDQVWEGLEEYIPKVVIIEFNPRYELREHTHNPETNEGWHTTLKTPHPGSSFMSLLLLGEKKGYTFVCTVGCNLFFVRNDLFPKLKLDAKILRKEATSG